MSEEHARRKGVSDVRYRNELVEQRRKELRITQAELARRSKLKQPAISVIEEGRWAPTLFNAWRIARALGLPLDDFLEEVKEGAVGEE